MLGKDEAEQRSTGKQSGKWRGGQRRGFMAISLISHAERVAPDRAKPRKSSMVAVVVSGKMDERLIRT